MHVKARVTAGAKKEIVVQTSVERLRISVREPAERNAANKRVIELVARHYNVPAKAVRMVNGHRSPSKTFSIPERLIKA